jgi:hypothetical protein
MVVRYVSVVSLMFICVATTTITHAVAQHTPALLTDQSRSATIPAIQTDTRSGDEDNDKSKLDIKKLNLEIDKLNTDKLLAYITTVLGFISGGVAVGAIVVQRQMALKTQQQSEKTNLELKVADSVMNSVGPTMARQRFGMFQDIYKDRLSKEFIEGVGNAIKQDSFPGTRRDQLRLELFKAIATKADSKNAAIEAFDLTFPDEKFLQKRAQTKAGEAAARSGLTTRAFLGSVCLLAFLSLSPRWRSRGT